MHFECIDFGLLVEMVGVKDAAGRFEPITGEELARVAYLVRCQKAMNRAAAHGLKFGAIYGPNGAVDSFDRCDLRDRQKKAAREIREAAKRRFVERFKNERR